MPRGSGKARHYATLNFITSSWDMWLPSFPGTKYFLLSDVHW